MKMKMMKGRFFRACLRKWRKMDTRVLPSATYDLRCQWALWQCMYQDQPIPKDVPRGHLVVYVGNDYKRFVIKATLLKHPVFKALLDQAKDEYEFNSNSRLCIPCEEDVFLDIIRCIGTPPDRRLRLCL